MNGNSASASEITAGAFKDYKKGILVGEKTFGKGSVQQPFGLSDGAEMKITVARWYTPNGNQIDEKGIDPDIGVVFQKEDYVNKYDRQLQTAQDVLKTFIENKNYTQTIDKFRQVLGNTGAVVGTGNISH